MKSLLINIEAVQANQGSFSGTPERALSFFYFVPSVHDEAPAVQRKKLHDNMKIDLEKQNKLSAYNNDMDSLRYAALCRGEDFRVRVYEARNYDRGRTSLG